MPVIIFYVVIGAILLVELAIVAIFVWLRMQERRRMRIVLPDPFEERSIVMPGDERPRAPVMPRRTRRRPPADDATGAYLAALDALERDGRWPRQPQETPARHAARLRGAGVELPALGRMAAAYQLVRYGQRSLPSPERERARLRLSILQRFLRQR